MSAVTDKLKELQTELDTELKKEAPDKIVVARLQAKIFTLGLQLTRNDMYLK